MKKITIIVPVYNAADFLHETMKDLINQTYDNLEIIVVDDCSTDNSREIIRDYMKLDSRIQLLEASKQGVSAARNSGLSLATGEYIRFIDADDRIPHDSIKRMYDAMGTESEIDLVIANYRYGDSEKNYFLGDMEGKQTAQVLAENFADHMKSYYYGVVWNKLYKKSIIDKENVTFDSSLTWCEDLMFNLDYFSHCKFVYYLQMKEGAYVYCVRESGITHNLSNADKIELTRVETVRQKRIDEYLKKCSIQSENFQHLWEKGKNYSRLCNLGKGYKATGKKFFKRYEEFSGILEEPVFHKEIKRELEKNPRYYIYSILLFSASRRHHYLVFLLFNIKEWIRKNTCFLLPLIRKIIKRPYGQL